MDKIIFVDFDGTITKVDTCEAMVKAYASGKTEEINRLWEQKKLTTIECATEVFKLLNTDLKGIETLMDTIEIDEYFIDFISLCKEKGYEVYILSDGYDFNINRILTRYGINIPFYSNKLLYDKGFQIDCPNYNSSCGKCGTCKTNLIKVLNPKEYDTIYIGDGYSDTCAVSNSNIIFAKGSLYKFCIENNLNAILFDSFKDIIDSNLI